MRDNNSSEIVFEPNNDKDDYTMATAYINEEFAKVKERTVQRYLKEFQESGILMRDGSDKSGKWILL